MPNSLHLSCDLLYKLVALVGRNVPLRENDRTREGKGNRGTKCEAAAEKVNEEIPCELVKLGARRTWTPGRVCCCLYAPVSAPLPAV